MEDIFDFFYKTNEESRNKIFEKSISEKRKLAFYIFYFQIF